MSDPIQHLRELMAKRDAAHDAMVAASYLSDGTYAPLADQAVHANRAWCDAVDDCLPALLAVAEAMRELERHELGKTANDIVSNALAKLDEVNHA